MKILYVAKHQSGGNDDEGAIAHALRELGHEVACLPETVETLDRGGDLLLFHHWQHPERAARFRGVKAFWCFDLIDWPADPMLAARCARRREWIARATAACDVGYVTDGDWAAADRTGKLRWLPQGADGRVVGSEPSTAKHDLMFSGIAKGGGLRREQFVAEMAERYGGRFQHVQKTYREQLRARTGECRIVVCPDAPVTDRYWSNRVYNACGFGAFVLHPWCARLAEQYEDGREIAYYDDREHMHKLVGWYLSDDAARRRIGRAALERTRAQHTYLRRCEVLMAEVTAIKATR